MSVFFLFFLKIYSLGQSFSGMELMISKGQDVL
jgi:hypothetical protein